MERVWETVMDPHQLKDWVTIHRSVKDVSDEPLRKGSTFDQVLHMRGVSFHVHWTLVDVSSPNVAEWEGRGPAHSRARIRYELSDEGNGATASSTRMSSPCRAAAWAASPVECHRRRSFRARGEQFAEPLEGTARARLRPQPGSLTDIATPAKFFSFAPASEVVCVWFRLHDSRPKLRGGRLQWQTLLIVR